jgi:hypothetical protein
MWNGQGYHLLAMPLRCISFYFSFGRLFLGETVYYTKNSTYTELEPYVRGCVRCYYYDYICYYYDRD